MSGGRSQMINFRLREEDIPKLDAAAKMSGMNRSDFIRLAVSEKVASMGVSQESLAAKDGRGEAKSKNSPGPFPDCPKSSNCKFQRSVTGIRVCATCGLKSA